MRHLMIPGALLALAAPAAGQETAPQAPAPAQAPNFTPEQLALGRRLAAAGDFNAVIGAMGAAEVERLAAETPDLSDGERARLRETGTRVLAAARARLLDRLAAVDAGVYSQDQLAAIVAFLEGPAGRAYVAGFPRLVPAIAQAMQGLDLAREIRAEYCRETGKLCETPAA